MPFFLIYAKKNGILLIFHEKHSILRLFVKLLMISMRFLVKSVSLYTEKCKNSYFVTSFNLAEVSLSPVAVNTILPALSVERSMTNALPW